MILFLQYMPYIHLPLPFLEFRKSLVDHGHSCRVRKCACHYMKEYSLQASTDPTTQWLVEYYTQLHPPLPLSSFIPHLLWNNKQWSTSMGLAVAPL